MMVHRKRFLDGARLSGIMDGGTMEQAFDGEKALYMYGREGYSVHSLYLFTHSGVGPNVNNDKLNGNSWQTIVDADDSSRRAGLNGKNHLASDWLHAGARIDIRQFPKKDTFTFRISSKMTDGFVQNKITKNMEDGAAVDKIEVVAILHGPNSPKDPPDPCDPSIPRILEGSCYNLPVDDITDPLGL